jgi:putative ATP-dependent endonuclease of OLD family
LDDKKLKTRLGQELSTTGIAQHLGEDSESQLARLKLKFADRALPCDLGLAITGAPGISIGPLVGLTAKRNDTILPLSSWGAGTRRLAALTISDTLQNKLPITVIDEVERGLEPYRQRALVRGLISGGSQIFLTTHSTTAIAAASEAHLWYLDQAGRLGEIPLKEIAEHQAKEPEIFLSRLTVVAEGITECGFINYWLEKGISDSLADHGIWIADAHGQSAALNLLEALTKGGFRFAGVVDSGESEPVRWKRLREKLGGLLLQWPVGCTEEYVISKIPDDKLLELIADRENEKTGARNFTLQRRIGASADSQVIANMSRQDLRARIIDAAKGTIPDEMANLPKELRNQFRGDSKIWFKSFAGGKELAEKAVNLGAWPAIKPQIMSFINSVRAELNLNPIEEILE